MKEYTVKVYDNGSKNWYINGKLHREDGPAIEAPDGYKAWYINDNLHREDGPAIEWGNGDKEWFIHGVELTKREFNKMTKQPKDIEEIIEKVRNLRDSDSHVCEYDVWQRNGEPNVETVPVCSCEQYDQVIDELEKLI